MGHALDYLATLPGGLDAYPEYVTKASGYRAFLEGLPQATLVEALPGSLRPLVTHPEPVSAWISEVHTNVLFLTALDVVFRDEAALLGHYERMNEKLLGGPLYRVLMMVASPAAIVRGASSRWDSFHRGVPLKAQSRGPHEAEVTLTWPKGLYNRILADCYARAFVVALRLAGAQSVHMEVSALSETGATYRGTWG